MKIRQIDKHFHKKKETETEKMKMSLAYHVLLEKDILWNLCTNMLCFGLNIPCSWGQSMYDTDYYIIIKS